MEPTTSTTARSASNVWPEHIKHVGLVGWPGCGKTTVAGFIADLFWGHICDDGAILRKALPILTGVSPWHCYSQEGKAEVVKIGSREETVRQGLGELGNYLEARYGEEIMPLRAIELGREAAPEAPLYIYPSVRKNQGKVYREAGGIIIEIQNPTVSPSANAFDVWNRDLVDLTFYNDPGLHTLADLLQRISDLPSCIAREGL